MICMKTRTRVGGGVRPSPTPPPATFKIYSTNTLMSELSILLIVSIEEGLWLLSFQIPLGSLW